MHRNARREVAHGTPNLWYLRGQQISRMVHMVRATYMAGANRGNTAPAMDLRNVFTAIALLL